MKTKNSKLTEISDESPTYESYTMLRSQGDYIFRTITIQGDKVIKTEDTPPYMLVEAHNKLKIAIFKLLKTIREDKGKNQV